MNLSESTHRCVGVIPDGLTAMLQLGPVSLKAPPPRGTPVSIVDLREAQ